MKIIDDKGRVFGLINLLDLIVLVLVLSIFPMLYYGYKITTRPKPIPKLVQPKYKFYFIWDKIDNKLISRDSENSDNYLFFKARPDLSNKRYELILTE